jgi:hypothetical protein
MNSVGGVESIHDYDQTSEAADAAINITEEGDAVVDKVEKPVEDNVVCGLFVLITAFVLDALCALPGAVLDDVPASLRTTSLSLIVLLGAPAVSKSREFLLEQRAVLGVLTAVAAFMGMNQAEPSARNADGLFSLVGVLSVIVACATNGTAVQHSTKQQRMEMREHLVALFGAMLWYIGTRIVRHALALPNEILGFLVAHGDLEMRGYGVVNDLSVLGMSFSGAIIAAFGAIVLLNHDLVLHVGSGALSSVAGILACFVFLGAFTAQISAFTLMERLPALFGSFACDGSYEECQAAYRARRLFTASTSTSSIWAAAVSMAVFSFSHQRRVASRKEHFLFYPDVYSPPYAGVIFITLACLAIVGSFVDENASMDWADIELGMLLLSVPLALFNMPILACAVHFAAQLIYVVTRFTLYGYYAMNYFTHQSILATLVITGVVTLLSLVSYFLYSFENQRLYWQGLEQANGMFMVALLSIQMFLTIGTAGMTSGYTGIFYESGKPSWRVSGYEFSIQHSVSFFFAAALFAVRYEYHLLSRAWMRAAWFIPTTLVGTSWMLCITLLDESGSPYEAYLDIGSFIIGMTAAAVSWVGVGLFLNT